MDNELKKHIIKTGTTTVGIVCKEGIVLAADKRSTYGGESGVSYIINKQKTKIVEVTPEIIVTIAGTASDTINVIKLMKAELKLKELKSKSKPSVKKVANLFSNYVYQNIRKPAIIPALTHFLLAGKDEEGIYLYEICADGLLKEVEDYTSSGSGMVNVYPILDTYYKENLSLKEAIDLAKKSILASTKRDPASGEGIDIYTVTEKGVEQIESKIIGREFKDE